MFLPISKTDMEERKWETLDFIYISGDAYVDHPSFGVAIISRVLEAHGYKIGIISQPNIKDPNWMDVLGTPRLGFLVTAGNIDSMVNHYSVSKKRRDYDYYSPGGKMGLRPDYPTIVYTQALKKKYPDIPVMIGGIEASLRRLAHYDYLSNSLKKSILIDSQADLLMYGMGERSIVEIADSLNSGLKISDVTYIKGTVWKTRSEEILPSDAIILPTYRQMCQDKINYAKSFYIQYQNNDAFNAKPLVEKYKDIYIVQNTPTEPLTRELMDWVYQLPYERNYHPIYEKFGGIPAILEVKNSITINRGCFGGCSFCALTSHQGRIIQSRSKESVIEEAKKIIKDPTFKGYINDIGGPTANFYLPSCKEQLTRGTCKNRECLHPKPCKNLIVSHLEYLDILRAVRKLPGIKKVFIRSGIRYDYLMYDKNPTFFKELVEHHISGQLKVAPEHVSNCVLNFMQKPNSELYFEFVKRYKEINRELNKNQYLVPYLMSSHPGSTLNDAIKLAEYLHNEKLSVEQVQDFYPTPSTLSTCMYYTGVDPRTLKEVYVAKTKEEKAMQRALIQYRNSQNYDLVKKALITANRFDLIGYGHHCLIKPDKPREKAMQRNKKNL